MAAPLREAAAAGRLEPEAAGGRIAELFERHGKMVYGVCRLMLRDRDEAEDAAQQTFLSAYRSMLDGSTPDDPAAWLGTIARNECRSRLRSRMRQPLIVVEGGDAAAPGGIDEVVGSRAEMRALCEALGELPAHQRDAVVLREFYGLTYEEVGAALGVSSSAVDSLLVRARKRLEHELRPARAASGAVAVPLALRDALAQALPGFAPGSSAAGLLAKAAAVPLAAKVSAAALTLAVAGGVAATAPRLLHRNTSPGRVATPAGKDSAPESTPVELPVRSGLVLPAGGGEPPAGATSPAGSTTQHPGEHPGGGGHSGAGTGARDQETEHGDEGRSGPGGGSSHEGGGSGHHGSGGGDDGEGSAHHGSGGGDEASGGGGDSSGSDEDGEAAEDAGSADPVEGDGLPEPDQPSDTSGSGGSGDAPGASDLLGG